MRNSSFVTKIGWTDENDIDMELEVSGDFVPGCPEVRYLKNGDPGYPAEPSEVDVHNISQHFADGDTRHFCITAIAKLVDDEEFYEKLLLQVENELAEAAQGED